MIAVKDGSHATHNDKRQLSQVYRLTQLSFFCFGPTDKLYVVSLSHPFDDSSESAAESEAHAYFFGHIVRQVSHPRERDKRVIPFSFALREMLTPPPPATVRVYRRFDPVQG